MAVSLKRTLIKGGKWAVAGKASSMLGALVLNLLLARALTPGDFGAYFLVTSTLIILTCLGTLGMDQVVIRRIAQRRVAGEESGQAADILRCLKVSVLGGALAATVVALLFHWIFAATLGIPKVEQAEPLILLWIFAATVQRQVSETMRGLNDIRLSVLFSGLRNNGILTSVFGCLAIGVLLLSSRLTLTTAFAAMAFSSLAVIGISVTQLLCITRRLTAACKGVPSDHARYVAIRYRDLLTQAWPLWLALTVTVVNNQGVSWIAGLCDTAPNVALFGVAQRMVLLLIAPMAIGNALLPPIVAELHAQNNAAGLAKVTQTISVLTAVVGIGLLLGLVVLGNFVLGTLFGDYYREAYVIMLVLCLGQLANMATGAWQIVLPMAGLRYEAFAVSAFAAASQFTFGYLAGQAYGIAGVAVAFCMVMIVSNVIGAVVVRRRLGVWTCANPVRLTQVASLSALRAMFRTRTHSTASGCAGDRHGSTM